MIFPLFEVIQTHMQSITDTIGFALLHLSLNDTTPIKWESLSKGVQKLFLRTMNKGIDKSKAEIRCKENFYTFFYHDELDEFRAFYVLLDNEVIFEYED
jgi:hypothetical protein